MYAGKENCDPNADENVKTNTALRWRSLFAVSTAEAARKRQVPDFIQALTLSTRNVDNCVDKGLLTSHGRSNGAGFNKMPVLKAKKCPRKINHLHVYSIYTSKIYAANSYKDGA